VSDDYAKLEERIAEKAYIVRIPFGPVDLMAPD